MNFLSTFSQEGLFSKLAPFLDIKSQGRLATTCKTMYGVTILRKQEIWESIKKSFPDLSAEHILYQMLEKKGHRLTEKEVIDISALIHQVGGDLGDAVSQILIQLAGSTNTYAVIKLLLSKGASVTARNPLGYTALHYAALKNEKKVCELLIEHGAEVNAKNHRNTTPLHLAAFACHLTGKIEETYTYLSSLPEVDTSIVNDSGKTAKDFLPEAAIPKEAEPSSPPSPYQDRIKENSNTIEEGEAEIGGDYEDYEEEIEIIQEEKEIEEDVGGDQPLVQINQEDLENLCDVSSPQGARFEALKNKYPQHSPLFIFIHEYRLLSEELPKDQQDSITDNLLAILHCSRIDVRLPFDIHAATEADLLLRPEISNTTLLHLVARFEFLVPVASLLIQKGANVDAVDAEEETPAHVAARYMNSGMLQLLKGQGANLFAANRQGQTPIQEFESRLKAKYGNNYFKTLAHASKLRALSKTAN